MTSFTNGPAKGQTLMLKRAPIFLRVVQDNAGKFDALDQPKDTPRPGEKLYAYRIREKPGSCHMSMRGATGQRTGGFYTIASYELVEEQPDQATMANADHWGAWCHAQVLPPHLQRIQDEMLKPR
jgi:hypothetical protein